MSTKPAKIYRWKPGMVAVSSYRPAPDLSFIDYSTVYDGSTIKLIVDFDQNLKMINSKNNNFWEELVLFRLAYVWILEQLNDPTSPERYKWIGYESLFRKLIQTVCQIYRDKPKQFNPYFYCPKMVDIRDFDHIPHWMRSYVEIHEFIISEEIYQQLYNEWKDILDLN